MNGTAILDERETEIRSNSLILHASLVIPESAHGIVLFAHGSGSSRHSPRNRFVAAALQETGLATLLFDLLTPEEEAVDRFTAHLRFDIGLLTRRLLSATDWVLAHPATRTLPLGYFGASTGGGAVLVAAAERPERVRAVVSRGGRPDLAGDALARVRAPTLLVVGGDDEQVLAINREAMLRMTAPVHLEVIRGATHLFQEPGALKKVADAAGRWFEEHLAQVVEPASVA